MSGYHPKVGDRVRVSVEGTVHTYDADRTIYFTDGRWVDLRQAPVAIEHLPDPEPEWRVGDVAVDEDCDQTWLRSIDGDWIGQDGRRHDDGEFAQRCPLTLLVRDGKQVQP